MWFYVLCAYAAYCLAKAVYLRCKYDLHKVPSPPSVPFLGHAIHFLRSKRPIPFAHRLSQWRADLGNVKLMKFDVFGYVQYIVLDAEFAREVVFAKNGSLPKSPALTNDFVHITTGDPRFTSLFGQPNVTPYVKMVRRAMARCMTSHALKMSIPKLRNVMADMVEYVDRECVKGTINVEGLFTRSALDAIGQIAFDYDMGAVKRKTKNCELIIACGRHMRNLKSSKLLQFKFNYMPTSKQARQVRGDFEKLIELWNDIAVHIRKRTDVGDPDTMIWAAFKDLRDPETNKPLPLELLRGECGTVVLGGTDTTGHLLGWTFALLGSNPHVLEKIIDELKTYGLFGKDARDVEFDDFADLQYLTAVLKEAMRVVHISIIGGRRVLDKDMTVLGYRLPKGTNITVAGSNMLVTAEDWDEPARFKPERWLSGEDMSKKFYFPFSGGERDCPGQRFGMNIMRFFMVKFITTYTFKLTNGETFDSLFAEHLIGVVVESKNGIKMQVEHRF